ncbi:hypothetical protein [Methylobacterium marchantiae]|uniref:Transposase IS116/IS110/IS902 family protein n=1 Tax=Methylobacterium marchantiae TaxID=600331 RepID=A0ABW3WW37_9HYPH
MAMLGDLLEDEMGSLLPPATVEMFRVMLDLLADLNDRIAELEREIARRDWEDETARRLMTIPGIGPITATALTALAPAAEPFEGTGLRCVAPGGVHRWNTSANGPERAGPLILVRRCHGRSSILDVSWR